MYPPGAQPAVQTLRDNELRACGQDLVVVRLPRTYTVYRAARFIDELLDAAPMRTRPYMSPSEGRIDLHVYGARTDEQATAFEDDILEAVKYAHWTYHPVSYLIEQLYKVACYFRHLLLPV